MTVVGNDDDDDDCRARSAKLACPVVTNWLIQKNRSEQKAALTSARARSPPALLSRTAVVRLPASHTLGTATRRTRGTVAIGKTCRVSPETPEQEEQVRLFFKDVLKR